jgi:hypothetical protein
MRVVSRTWKLAGRGGVRRVGAFAPQVRSEVDSLLQQGQNAIKVQVLGAPATARTSFLCKGGPVRARSLLVQFGGRSFGRQAKWRRGAALSISGAWLRMMMTSQGCQ